MKRISFKGVLVGAITDIIATNIAAIPVLGYAAFRIDLAKLPVPQQSQALLAAVQASVPLYLALFTLGALCSVLGGYVAALLARRDRVLNGALSAFLCAGLGLWSLLQGNQQMPAWLEMLFLPVSPALGALGGYLREAHVRARSNRGPLAPSEIGAA